MKFTYGRSLPFCRGSSQVAKLFPEAHSPIHSHGVKGHRTLRISPGLQGVLTCSLARGSHGAAVTAARRSAQQSQSQTLRVVGGQPRAAELGEEAPESPALPAAPAQSAPDQAGCRRLRPLSFHTNGQNTERILQITSVLRSGRTRAF